MIKLIDGTTARNRLMSLAIRAANHLGHIPADQPDYNPLLDNDVLVFLEQAVTNEVQAESQQAHYLDVLDREV